jgi:indolepyruvate ferredoxin oxidoreductase alpha subunit
VADAAILCPSFYRADVVHNPGAWEARFAAFRARIISWLQARRTAKRLEFRA